MISVVNNVVLRQSNRPSFNKKHRSSQKDAIRPFPSAKCSMLPGDISFKGVFGLRSGNCLLPSITERPMIEAVVCTLIYMAAISSQQENTITQGLIMNNATLESTSCHHRMMHAHTCTGTDTAAHTHTRTLAFNISEKVFPTVCKINKKVN